MLGCARTVVEPEEAESIRVLAEQPLDWEYLCKSAEKHRLTQLLFRNLTSICPDSIPPDVQKLLRYRFYSNAGTNLKLAHALTGLLQLFAERDIEVIPFKGSILANGAYGKLALRKYCDLDLFIPARDLEKSGQLLSEQGYLLHKSFDTAQSYRHKDNGVEIDVHWGFAPRYFHLPVDFNELYSRTRVESLLGQPVTTFSAEDLLLILCLQVVKDSWERQQRLEHLSKVCDIAEHLRAHPGIEWPQVIERARKDGLQRILRCSLVLARELLGAELEPTVLNYVESDPKARKYARWLSRCLFTDADTLSPPTNSFLAMGLRFRQLSFYLGMRERYREQFRHVVEIFRLGSMVRTRNDKLN
ncbi:nucleotidyltransferase family protein [Pseudomonadota bacterium]